jgi:hypothetical protein
MSEVLQDPEPMVPPDMLNPKLLEVLSKICKKHNIDINTMVKMTETALENMDEDGFCVKTEVKQSVFAPDAGRSRFFMEDLKKFQPIRILFCGSNSLIQADNLKELQNHLDTGKLTMYELEHFIGSTPPDSDIHPNSVFVQKPYFFTNHCAIHDATVFYFWTEFAWFMVAARDMVSGTESRHCYQNQYREVVWFEDFMREKGLTNSRRFALEFDKQHSTSSKQHNSRKTNSVSGTGVQDKTKPFMHGLGNVDDYLADITTVLSYVRKPTNPPDEHGFFIESVVQQAQNADAGNVRINLKEVKKGDIVRFQQFGSDLIVRFDNEDQLKKAIEVDKVIDLDELEHYGGTHNPISTLHHRYNSDVQKVSSVENYDFNPDSVFVSKPHDCYNHCETENANVISVIGLFGRYVVATKDIEMNSELQFNYVDNFISVEWYDNFMVDQNSRKTVLMWANEFNGHKNRTLQPSERQH